MSLTESTAGASTTALTTVCRDSGSVSQFTGSEEVPEF
jgi:hypothetical protein